MNGDPKLKNVGSIAIDLEGDSIVDGWYYFWDASGYEEGNYYYHATSINYPVNTMSDSLYINNKKKVTFKKLQIY